MASKLVRRGSILQRAVVETLDRRVLLSGTPHDYVWKEAENYDVAENASDGHYWDSYSQGGFSGSGVQAKEKDKVKYEFGDAASSARLDYTANFAQAGKYYVWVRGIGFDGNSDSVHIGINGQPALSAGNIAVRREGVLWSTFSTENGAGGYIIIPSAGQHTINLFMREAGTSVDQIMMTTDKAFRPANAPPVPAVTLTGTNTGTTKEGNTTGVTYTFTRSSGAGANTLQVTGIVTGGDANADDYTVTGDGVTYNAAVGTFTIEFGINDVQKQITVRANADARVEGDEYVVLELNEPGGSSPTYHLGDSTQTHTTLEDDTVLLNSLTIANADSSDQSRTVTLQSGSPEVLELSWDSFDTTRVNIDGTLSSTVDGYNPVFGIFADGIKIADVTSGTAILDWGAASQYDIKGGVDKNRNNQLDAGEEQLQQPVKPAAQPATVNVTTQIMQGFVNEQLPAGSFAKTKFRIHCNVTVNPQTGQVTVDVVVEAWIALDLNQINAAIQAGIKDKDVPAKPITQDGVYGHEQRHIESIMTEVGKLQADLNGVGPLNARDTRTVVKSRLEQHLDNEVRHKGGSSPTAGVMYPSDPNKPGGAFPAQPAAQPPQQHQNFPAATGGVLESLQ